MLNNGDLRPSKSPYATPLHVAKKNGPEKHRFCGDYRRLNACTRPDRYPVPNILDFNAGLAGATIFSVLVIKKAYYHIPVAAEDIEKTAIITPCGLYEHVTMPFGLRNAAQTFQRFMDELLRDLDFAYVYIDDVLIASPSEAEHEQHVRTILKRLDDAGFTLNVSKCVYAQQEVIFLGHTVTKHGIKPSSERVSTISEFPLPTTVEDLRRFLGMINFYRRGIPHAAAIQARLQQLIT